MPRFVGNAGALQLNWPEPSRVTVYDGAAAWLSVIFNLGVTCNPGVGSGPFQPDVRRGILRQGAGAAREGPSEICQIAGRVSSVPLGVARWVINSFATVGELRRA